MMTTTTPTPTRRTRCHLDPDYLTIVACAWRQAAGHPPAGDRWQEGYSAALLACADKLLAEVERGYEANRLETKSQTPPAKPGEGTSGASGREAAVSTPSAPPPASEAV